MKRFISKKTVAVGLAAGLILGASGAAFAYFTATGSGTGSANVGSTANDITVVGTETLALTPAGPGGTVSFTASNPENFNQKISSITLANITPDSLHSGCATVLGTDFSMSTVLVGTDGNLAPNASNATLSETGTLNMLDSGVSQDACQGATLTLSFTTA